MSIENLKAYDPFADTGDDDKDKHGIIHIRIQQRNGRKTLTTVQGLPSEFDPNRILKTLKKEFATNGNVVKDPDLGEVIQFQGDQRGKIQDFLIEELSITKNKIKIHGF